MNQLVPINHSPADMAITFKYTIFNTQLHTRDQSHADLLQDNLQRTIPAHIKKGSTTVPLPKTMANISLRADSQQWKDAEEAEARQLTLSNSLELIAKYISSTTKCNNPQGTRKFPYQVPSRRYPQQVQISLRSEWLQSTTKFGKLCPCPLFSIYKDHVCSPCLRHNPMA